MISRPDRQIPSAMNLRLPARRPAHHESDHAAGAGQTKSGSADATHALPCASRLGGVGGGAPFLPPVNEGVRLDLVETRTFGSRVIYERYGRAGDESD
jgi:hypothetical protein